MCFLLKSGAKIEVCKQTSKYFIHFFILPPHKPSIIILQSANNSSSYRVGQADISRRASPPLLLPGQKPSASPYSTKRLRLEPAYAFHLSKQIRPHYPQTNQRLSPLLPMRQAKSRIGAHPRTLPAEYLHPACAKPRK